MASGSRDFARVLVAGLWLLAAAALAQPSQGISVVGEVKTSLALTAAELRGFPAEQQASFVQSRGAAGKESPTTIRGVRLAAVIERAGLKTGRSDDWKTLVVVATATDGYRAVFSWMELSNSEAGDGVLLVYERDGHPLDEREGQIALASTRDRRLGPRHVRNLQKLEVRQVDR